MRREKRASRVVGRAPALLSGALCLSPAGCAPEAERPGVAILEPADGASLESGDVRVVFEAHGIEIAPASDQQPGTAHHHLFVDQEPTPPGDTIPSGVTGIVHLGRGQSEFTLRGLAPGEHAVIAVLGDPWHLPVEEAATDTVRFRIGERPQNR